MAAPPPAPDHGTTAGRLIRDPRVVAAAAAIAVRAVVASQANSRGVPTASLDGELYLAWAADIAGGDVFGRGGVVAGGPFLFNPLYAYVLAPIVAVFGPTGGAVVWFQTALAGATAAFAAAAAGRFAGRSASWVAGLATAFSAALVHLDGKVGASALAAFLIAGATWSLSPDDTGGAPRRGHGPMTIGLWIGASLLARPVTLFAIPLVALLVARKSSSKARYICIFLLPIVICGSISFARNVAVSDAYVPFTAADGLNLHLGNNPAARRSGAMTSDEFEFSPTAMHEDAKYRVAFELHRDPTRSEVSSWFSRRALRELTEAPGASIVWYATKLRWFAGPEELGSSYDLERDRALVPAHRLAFVPTWAIVALAAAAAFAVRRRATLLLGPGALVFAHAAACTLSYPLSHYRSPCLPAAAALAGVCIAGVIDLWRARRVERAGAVLLVAAGIAVIGAVPPQPGAFPGADLSREAQLALDRGDLKSADDLAVRALAFDPDDAAALAIRLSVANKTDRFADEREFAVRLVALRPWNPHPRLDVAYCDARLGRKEDSLRGADEVVAMYPWSAEVVGWRGKIRAINGDVAGAKADLLWAMERGFTAPDWLRRRVGL